MRGRRAACNDFEVRFCAGFGTRKRTASIVVITRCRSRSPNSYSADPLAITLRDPYPDEQRWRTIGTPGTRRDVVLFGVHTWPEEDETGEEVGRIISARKATRRERRAYEDGTF